MPKKGKKGKGKGKKGGKKGGKKTPKKDKDVELTMAVANAKLWSSRLEISEKSRNEYRETCKKMATENERLHNTLYQTEKDTIEVVDYLKQGDLEKDEQIIALQHEVLALKEQAKAEKNNLVSEFNGHITELEGRLDQRTKEVQAMQAELKLVKEFRRRRTQMETELDTIRESLHTAQEEHSETLHELENKFLSEKQRLEKEASEKIAELAERAHTDAIANLDEPTRSIYKENIRLNESLRYHVQEANFLQHQTDSLTSQAASLKEKKAVSDVTVKEKVTESKHQKQELKELNEKIKNLEQALQSMVKDFRVEKRATEQKSRTKVVASQGEVHRLSRILELKNQEMNRVKVVAKRVVAQRSSTELYFLEALEQVRNEVVLGRANYVEEAREAYQRKMVAAHSGQAEFPKVKSGAQHGTEEVALLQEHNLNWSNLAENVDVRNLTWEQKEKVLRLLFTRMNNEKAKSLAPSGASEPLLSIDDKPLELATDTREVGETDKLEANTSEEPAFLTQPQDETSVTLPSINV